ncbi:helix-turn-helix domain-containing protein [Amphibacillus sp. Q70]|uniref:helix-turn-helix domain-containing protein n=1 Tax=Amphibacillus sp. Q70 TaxID=3453416 RepID=UPI003F84E5B6
MLKISLSAARENLGFSAKKVAKEIGIHQQTLLKYEKDSTDIPISLLNILCNYYQVPKDYIFLGNKYELTRIIEFNREKQPT